MRLWCSSSGGVAWSWSWQPYPGVWLFVLLIAIGYWFSLRRQKQLDETSENNLSTRQAALFGAGLLCLWIALDWPLGPLGSGYLASVHMVRYLLLALIAPPLLLLGIPARVFSSLKGHSGLLALLRDITQPLVAFFIFNIVISVTHWPSIVDQLMATQLGSFLLDLAWLAAGLIFWWPVISPIPEWPAFTHVWKLAYLGLNGILVRPVFFILLFSKFPAYATFELAPPIGRISAVSDQQLAAGVMKLGTAWTMVIAIAFVFFAWVRASESRSPARTAP
jgi:cytochrome c oxidase assembly factor CtaG